MNQHATCQHRVYQLTCEQFDALLERSGGRCEVCGRTDVRLWIDHQHGGGHVRGLLCPGCNSHMGVVDAGDRRPTSAVRQYLSKALIETAVPAFSRRVFVCDEELWLAALDIARQRGESLSEVIRDALRRYVGRNQ